MTKETTSLQNFLNKSFLFKDKNDKVHPFNYIKYGDLRWKFILNYYKLLGYEIKVLDKKDLHSVMTTKNKNISMSLQRSFSQLEIVKIQKKNEDNLVFYHLYLFVKDKEGIKTEILG